MPGRNDPRGLVPSRHLMGATSFNSRRRKTNARNLTALRKGDPVYLDANGEVQRALVATAAGQSWLGVVTGVYNDAGRPFTHTVPPVLAASTSGFVDVCEDPFVVYTIHCSASIEYASIGAFVNILYVNTNTAQGISSCALDGTDTTTSSIGHPLKIVGVAPNELGEDPQRSAANQDVEVIITQHMWTNPVTRLLVQSI